MSLTEEGKKASKKSKAADKAEANGNGKQEKTKCPVTLAEFAAGAKALDVTIGDKVYKAVVKAPFSTGSFGWNVNDKMTIEIAGKELKVQVGMNLTVVGSKEAGK